MASSLCPLQEVPSNSVQEGMTDTCPLDGGCWSQYPPESCDNKDDIYGGTSQGCDPASNSINLLIAALIHLGADDFICHTGAL